MSTNKDIYNFSAGPSMLPKEVMQRAQAEFLDYQGSGMSIAEVSHRGPLFKEVADQLHVNMRAALSIPDNFEILFSAGGGQGQFAAVPMNLIHGFDMAAYLVSGHWSRKAFSEAKKYTDPACVFDADSTGYHSIADVSEWNLPNNAAYLYCCDNETVHGLMLSKAPKVDMPVVCDMTSSLMTGPVNWDRYSLVFAGCQKNIAPAGMTVVIVRKDLLERTAIKETPNFLDYQSLTKSGSMPNTPATFSWYIANLTCQWVIKQGGVEEMQRCCLQRSSLLYDAIDQSNLYFNEIEKNCRSIINVCFKLKEESLQAAFLAGAEEEGLFALKGHRAVGGIRANLYNAMPMAGVEKLVAFMQAFEKQAE